MSELTLTSSYTTLSGCAGFEWDVVRKTKCEVHIFDPTLSLGTQQELRRVKEFKFHDIGLIAEGLKVQQSPPSSVHCTETFAGSTQS